MTSGLLLRVNRRGCTWVGSLLAAIGVRGHVQGAARLRVSLRTYPTTTVLAVRASEAAREAHHKQMRLHRRLEVPLRRVHHLAGGCDRPEDLIRSGAHERVGRVGGTRGVRDRQRRLERREGAAARRGDAGEGVCDDLVEEAAGRQVGHLLVEEGGDVGGGGGGGQEGRGALDDDAVPTDERRHRLRVNHHLHVARRALQQPGATYSGREYVADQVCRWDLKNVWPQKPGVSTMLSENGSAGTGAVSKTLRGNFMH